MFKKIFLLFLLLLLITIPTTTIEARRTRANLSWPTSPLGTEVTETRNGQLYFREDTNIPIIVQYFYEWMIVLGGLAAFIAFIWAGLLYMISVGDANKMTDAKKKIKRALLGLTLLMSSYLIFNLISPAFTELGERPIAIDRGLDIELDIQARIKNFAEVYSKCRADYIVRRRLIIHVPLPLLGFTINIGRLLERFAPPGTLEESEYFTFCGDIAISGCGRLSEKIENQCPFNFSIYIPKLDADGNIIIDQYGNPILIKEQRNYLCFKKDDDGNCILEIDNYQDLIGIDGLNFYRPEETERWWHDD